MGTNRLGSCSITDVFVFGRVAGAERGGARITLASLDVPPSPRTRSTALRFGRVRLTNAFHRLVCAACAATLP